MWFGGVVACGEISPTRKAGQGLGSWVFTGVVSRHQAILNSWSVSPVYLGPTHGLIPLIVLALFSGNSGHGTVMSRNVTQKQTSPKPCSSSLTSQPPAGLLSKYRVRWNKRKTDELLSKPTAVVLMNHDWL